MPDHLEASTVHPRRTEIANTDICSYADTFHTRSEQPTENLALVDWMETFEFYALQLFRSASSHSQNVVISEQSIGRQKPLNCLCEGLLVFLFFKPQVRIIVNFTVHVENQLNKIYFAIISTVIINAFTTTILTIACISAVWGTAWWWYLTWFYWYNWSYIWSICC